MARQLRSDEPAQPYALRLTTKERERLREAARVNHQTPAAFARMALVTAAEDCLEISPSADS
jgi:uncharacterized protein (DUF1778 family)